MTNNDILIRIRYALNITDIKLMELFALAGRRVGREELEPLFRKEGEPGWAECDAATLRAFLEGLVASRRGPRETGGPRESAGTVAGARGGSVAGSAGSPAAGGPRPSLSMSNNEVLKHLRIALELKDGDIVDIMRAAGVEVSKSEIGALFRKKGHENWRQCGDQFLRNFLAGLTAKRR